MLFGLLVLPQLGKLDRQTRMNTVGFGELGLTRPFGRD